MRTQAYPNPSGLCQCGCGATTSSPRRRYLVGHQSRKSPVEYIIDETTGCWLWQRAIASGTGYGVATVNGRTMGAHRAMYERLRGTIPDGLVLNHICPHGPTRSCVNPDHLEAVPQKINVWKGGGPKLTREDVALIQGAPADVNNTQLAHRFGIHRAHVSRVRRGIHWEEPS